MDRSADPDAFSKPFGRNSSPPSTPSSSLFNKEQESSKQTHLDSPPWLIKSESDSSHSQTSTNASVNGHAPDLKEEHPKDRNSDLTYSENDTGESNGDWFQYDIDADIRRVKVYALVGQKWTDRGTAVCQGDYDEETGQARLIAHAQHYNEILLQCIIRNSDVYQPQQDTFIVWTEPGGTDFALSFQDIEGCGEVWEIIGEVQRQFQDEV